MIHYNHHQSNHHLVPGSEGIMSPKGEQHQSQPQQQQQQPQSQSQQQQHQAQQQQQQQPQPVQIQLSRHQPLQLMHQSDPDGDDFVRDTDSPPPPDLVHHVHHHHHHHNHRHHVHHRDHVPDQMGNGIESAVISGHSHPHPHPSHQLLQRNHPHHRHNQHLPHRQSHHLPPVRAIAPPPPPPASEVSSSQQLVPRVVIRSHTNGCIRSIRSSNGSILEHDHRKEENRITIPGRLTQEQLLSLRSQVKQIQISHHQTVQKGELGLALVGVERSRKVVSRSDWSSLSPQVMDRILSHVSLSDAYQMSLVCINWSRMVMREEDSQFWHRICTQIMPSGLLKSGILSNVPTWKGKVRSLHHTWNEDDCSRNIYVKSHGFTIHRNPVAQSTDAARGKRGFRTGRHCWEIWWEGPLGTVSVIGISTKEQQLQSTGYVPLIGSSSHSWGWNLVDHHLLYDNEVHGSYPMQNNAPKYTTGERIRVILDCDRHTLSFEKNDEFLGVAFVGLPAKTLYPAVSAVYGNTEVSMVYHGFPLDG